MPDIKNNINKISVVIITHNEARNILSCIHSCQKISDDIVVVDSFSSDSTVEIIAKSSARIFQKTWEGYGNAKNLGSQLCLNDWILSIDADERLDDTMSNSLLEIELNPEFVYAFRRINHLGQKRIRFGSWNPDIKERLYFRRNASWSHHYVHEHLAHNDNIKRKIIDGNILHFSFHNIVELEDKLEKYEKLKLLDKLRKNKNYRVQFPFLQAISRFLKDYLFKFGLLDGKNGYLIARANAMSILKRRKLLRELKETESSFHLD